jgi:carboxymethylenebutenolidase
MPMVEIDGVSAYRAEPNGAPKGGLILIHEIWGLVDHIREVADRFAAAGYLVIAPDLLSDAGMTPVLGQEVFDLLHSDDEAKRVEGQPLMRELTGPTRAPEFAAGALAKLRLVVDELEETPGVDGRIAVAGFCFGGTYSFALAADDDRVRAAVPFYGSAPDPNGISDIHCPVLAFYGVADLRLMDDLPRVTTQMAENEIPFEAVVYPDAGHAFFNDTSARTYVEADAVDAWAKTLAFLEKQLR